MFTVVGITIINKLEAVSQEIAKKLVITVIQQKMTRMYCVRMQGNVIVAIVTETRFLKNYFPTTFVKVICIKVR